MVEDIEVRMGTGGQPPKIGIFIRNFLREVGEAYPSEIHKAYKTTFRGQKTTKGERYRLGTYRSHLVYIRGLARAGLIERTNHTEPSNNPKADPIQPLEERVYFRLTSKGETASDYVWTHPLRLWYKPFDWEYATYGNYIK